MPFYILAPCQCSFFYTLHFLLFLRVSRANDAPCLCLAKDLALLFLLQLVQLSPLLLPAMATNDHW